VNGLYGNGNIEVVIVASTISRVVPEPLILEIRSITSRMTSGFNATSWTQISQSSRIAQNQRTADFTIVGDLRTDLGVLHHVQRETITGIIRQP
jgi:hypothetical protein